MIPIDQVTQYSIMRLRQQTRESKNIIYQLHPSIFNLRNDIEYVMPNLMKIM